MEAIVEALKKIESDKVSLEVIHSAVGTITESDVLLASASSAIILGFHTRIDVGVADLAKREGVQIKLYSIIYELIDQVKEAMAGLLEPVIKEVVIGSAEVRKIFELSKGGNVAGCMVTSGRIVRGKARVLRRKGLIYEGVIQTLRRFQDEVNEVRAGMECGIRIEGFNEMQPGDIIECFTTEKVAPKLILTRRCRYVPEIATGARIVEARDRRGHPPRIAGRRSRLDQRQRCGRRPQSAKPPPSISASWAGDAQKKRAMEALEQTPQAHPGPGGARQSFSNTPRNLRFVLDESVERGNRVLQHPGRTGKAASLARMKSHPKIIDRILESNRREPDHLRRRPCPARRRLHRLATGPDPGLAQAGQGGRLLERGCRSAKIRLPGPGPACCKSRASGASSIWSSRSIARPSSAWAAMGPAVAKRKMLDQH